MCGVLAAEQKNELEPYVGLLLLHDLKRPLTVSVFLFGGISMGQ